MATYSCPLQKSVKWYRKLAFEFLLNTALVNAYIVYGEVTGKTIGINEFRVEIVKFLTCSVSNIYKSMSVGNIP